MVSAIDRVDGKNIAFLRVKFFTPCTRNGMAQKFKIIICKPFVVGIELRKCVIDRFVDYAEIIIRIVLDVFGL